MGTWERGSSTWKRVQLPGRVGSSTWERWFEYLGEEGSNTWERWFGFLGEEGSNTWERWAPVVLTHDTGGCNAVAAGVLLLLVLLVLLVC